MLQINDLNYNLLIKIIISSIFIISYILIIIEEKININKSTISILTASILWIIISLNTKNDLETIIINKKITEILQKYCELLIFLFVTLIYINIIKKLGIINYIIIKIIKKQTSYKEIYWKTGFLAFFISPLIDNLTTAIFIFSIINTIEQNDKKFINLCSVNIVIASNAGGVFSPFGDITTLMIWQNNLINTTSFIYMFLPSFICFIIPSFIINKKIENKKIELKIKNLKMNSLKIIIILTFLLNIIITVIIQSILKISIVIGLLIGLALLSIIENINNKKNKIKINIKNAIKKIDWNTLIFFIGIMLCIGALSQVNMLKLISEIIYNNQSNINCIIGNSIVGLISAILDNIPLTIAILEMNVNMNENNWMLLALTTGTGGSILSIGSPAGIALMGISKNKYTFISHLKYSSFIFIGYIISIITHIILN